MNVALLFVACVGVAWRRSLRSALLLAVGGASAILFRGYLVPFTPQFAPQLVAQLPGDPFHENDNSDANTPETSGTLGGDPSEETGEQIVAALAEDGVLVADEETLYLADQFREAWRAEMDKLRTNDDAALADALRGATPKGSVVNVVHPEGDTWFVVSDGSGDPANETWLTRPVAVAEVGAVSVLADETSLDATFQAQAVGPLRTFLQSCPICDGPVEETTAVECCGGPGPGGPDEVLACTDCNERLYTFQ
ncbi:hypothetical protein [Halorussus halophilus]|uniref:hypothetical protein n=1 Tax=Halorussus halophilus TaxID=2650975 RepID=UPI001300DCC8|nr:hypothetical protein [Halorussus halophilus]